MALLIDDAISNQSSESCKTYPHGDLYYQSPPNRLGDPHSHIPNRARPRTARSGCLTKLLYQNSHKVLLSRRQGERMQERY